MNPGFLPKMRLQTAVHKPKAIILASCDTPRFVFPHGVIPRRLMQLLRIGLSAVLLVLIWQHLPAQQLFVSLQTVSNNGLLVVAVVLLPLNYYLEAVKWRALLPADSRRATSVPWQLCSWAKPLAS